MPMPSPLHTTTFRAAAAAAAFACVLPAAAAAPLVVEPATTRTNVFAGRAAAVGVVVRGGGAVEGTLVWALTVARRALADGAVAVRHGGDDPTAATITIDVPDVRAGVVVDAMLTVALVDAVGARLGTCSRVLRIFPADPFAGRTRWLASRTITLVDPPGRTDQVFRAAGVPFTLVAADGDLAAIRGGLVVVGEGTSWVEHPGLPRALTALAARGVNVLCLAPFDGAMPLPGSADGPGASVATSLVLRRADIVADLDARLDWRHWRDGPEPTDAIVSGITIAADGADVVARAGTTPTAWPWLEAAFAPSESETPAAKILVCGLGVVGHWDDTPAARYVLAALLERLTANQPERAESEPPRAPSPPEDDR